MKIIATYCSKNKIESKFLIPAVERYNSKRIKNLHEKAKVKGLPFFILSGKFGFISSGHLIPNYDKLLKSEDAESLSKLIERQLTSNGIKEVTFFTRNLQSDPNIEIYINCLKMASRDSVVLHLKKTE